MKNRVLNSSWIMVTFYCLLVLLGTSCVGQQEETATEAPSPALPCQTSSGDTGFCGPLTACPFLSSAIDLLANNTCQFDDNTAFGVCCSNVSIALSASERQHLPERDFVPKIAVKPDVDQKEINESSIAAIETIEKQEKLEETLVEEGLTNENDTAEDLHDFINFAQLEAQGISEIGELFEELSRLLDRKFRLLSHAIESHFDLDESPIDCDSEHDKIECTDDKYRTIDGSCNNLQFTSWGKSNTAFTRLFQHAQYADGISKPRIAQNGEELPNCRLLTTSIIQTKSKMHPHIDILFMAFGQFVDHDLDQTPTHRVNASGGEFKTPRCCPPEVTPELRHPECMQIEIPKDDPFYKTFKKECMEFVRSIEVASNDCNLVIKQREQLNQLTSYLDASQIYGSIEHVSRPLRSHTNGRLRADVIGREFPPHKVNDFRCNGDLSKGMMCFETGDTRATEQPLLGILHTIFLREHNRIANRLASLNPEWDDEILFQETRRIVIAIYQQIIYNEFLPILLGNKRMREFELELQKEGFFDEYEDLEDASIMNEFATAAFRFGHSLVQSSIQLISADGKVETQRLLDHFVKPFNATLFDDYVRGVVSQPIQTMDENVIPDLTNHLFQSNGKFGLDLAAINCQRGRDHAIGSYTQLRDTCFLDPVDSFEDLEKHMDPQVAKSFSQVYKSVRDIDLWIAGISEDPYPDAVVGPVFACIIGEQFRRLRHGDRFWFERGNDTSSFNEEQLAQIRKASLARLFCDNSDIEEIQPLALFSPSEWNPKLPCTKSKAIPSLSLKPWRNGTTHEDR